jgi:hypothetical protein
LALGLLGCVEVEFSATRLASKVDVALVWTLRLTYPQGDLLVGFERDAELRAKYEAHTGTFRCIIGERASALVPVELQIAGRGVTDIQWCLGDLAGVPIPVTHKVAQVHTPL